MKLIKWGDVFPSSFEIVEKGYEELSKVQILEELELSTIFNIRRILHKQAREDIFERPCINYRNIRLF